MVASSRWGKSFDGKDELVEENRYKPNPPNHRPSVKSVFKTDEGRNEYVTAKHMMSPIQQDLCSLNPLVIRLYNNRRISNACQVLGYTCNFGSSLSSGE
jgi:hypothetical protein